jgi:hypothetical protein
MDSDSDMSASIAQQRPEQRLVEMNMKDIWDQDAAKEDRLAMPLSLQLLYTNFLLEIPNRNSMVI